MGKSLVFAAAVVCGAALAGYGVARAQHHEGTKNTMEIPVQHFEKQQEVKYPWGWIRWMMSSGLDKDAGQTFGLVQVNAGQKNALHMHPNCEELLYVLSGSCEHLVGDKKVTLHPGDLIRVPAGVKHQAIVLGNEPLKAVISYSSGDRKVVDYGDVKE